MRLIALFLVLGACPAVLASQEGPPAYVVKGQCPEDGLPHFHQWVENSGVGSGKTYVAEAKRKQQIIAGYSKLQLNMSQKAVEGVMGKPDYSAAKLKGHLATAPAPDPPVCPAQFAYILKKDTDNAADLNDEAVFVFFTPEDKLYWATPLNVPALKVIGSPAP